MTLLPRGVLFLIRLVSSALCLMKICQQKSLHWIHWIIEVFKNAIFWRVQVEVWAMGVYLSAIVEHAEQNRCGRYGMHCVQCWRMIFQSMPNTPHTQITKTIPFRIQSAFWHLPKIQYIFSQFNANAYNYGSAFKWMSGSRRGDGSGYYYYYHHANRSNVIIN